MALVRSVCSLLHLNYIYNYSFKKNQKQVYIGFRFQRKFIFSEMKRLYKVLKGY